MGCLPLSPHQTRSGASRPSQAYSWPLQFSSAAAPGIARLPCLVGSRSRTAERGRAPAETPGKGNPLPGARMINIISKQVGESRVSGPQKVLVNLVKGLERIGYPYALNRHPSAARRLWIHDDVAALRFMHQPGVLPVLGPNLFVMPVDAESCVDFGGAVYLQPSEWAVRFLGASRLHHVPPPAVGRRHRHR